MVNLGYHSNTSMAVKAVVTEVQNKLAKRFDFLENLPTFFYDFEKGQSPQFLQYYAKIPFEKRKNEWIVLAYSYDTNNASHVHPRRGLEYKRPIKPNTVRAVDVRYVEQPIVFSILTNSSKSMNGISNYLLQKFDNSFTVKFQDLLWPTWKPNSNYPLGWYIRPSKPNGKVYQTSNIGLSGDKEPEWSTIENTIDNELEWEPKQPDLISVRASEFVKQDGIVQNPIENGVMYQYDFGFTLHYVDFDDDGKIIGRITEIELALADIKGSWQEIMSVKAKND